MPAPSEQSTKEIAITIRPTEDVTKHADFLAQADQQGSGAFREAHWMSSNSPAPMPSDASTGEAQLEILEKCSNKENLNLKKKYS